jgi:hypothetical protein
VPDREEMLHGRWLHAHEEDAAGAMVFRRAGHPLPRSRGRTSLDLRPDGSYVEESPGPVDLPEESHGTWALEGDRLILGADGDRPGHAWELVDVADDRFEVR